MQKIRELRLNFSFNYLEILSFGFGSFIISIIFTLIFIKEKIIPNHYSNDHTISSQKIHNNKRIGRLSIILSIFSMIIFSFYSIFYLSLVKINKNYYYRCIMS